MVQSYSPRPVFAPEPAHDPVKLAATGRQTRARLQANEAARDLGGTTADLFVVPGFLRPAECRRLVRVIDSRIGPSELFAGTEVDGFRTSSTHHFDGDDPAVTKIGSRIHALLGIDSSHAEVMQGQRYAPSQQYRHHYDYFLPDQPYWPQERRRGGQRSWTAMIYLNCPQEGGATDFAELGLAVEPQVGAVLVWNNMDRDGWPNPATLHAGLPVIKGHKYVITQWYRQDRWSLELR